MAKPELVMIMRRIALLAAPLAFLFSVGCGGSSTTSETAQTASSPASTQTAAAVSPPTEVVSQFLDQVRRGGGDSVAGQFLTVKAQAELKRIGRSVQPIGSPKAKFEVTRGEEVPGDENAVLVHSIWTEPLPDGNKSEFQVVWAVQKESAGWRISGLAMELEPGAAPTIIDFENGALMAKLLAQPAAESEETPPAQAAVPQDATKR